MVELRIVKSSTEILRVVVQSIPGSQKADREQKFGLAKCKYT